MFDNHLELLGVNFGPEWCWSIILTIVETLSVVLSSTISRHRRSNLTQQKESLPIHVKMKKLFLKHHFPEIPFILCA